MTVNTERIDPVKVRGTRKFYGGTFEMEYERPLRDHMRKYPKADRIGIAARRKRAARYHWILLERKSDNA